MKYLVNILFFFICSDALSQIDDNAICHVFNVKGEIRKPNDSIIAAGDTLLFKGVKNLKFISNGSMITLYERKEGSFRISKAEFENRTEHESIGHFILHFLKIKGRKVPLSSRGDCTCLTPKSCFDTDTLINDKNLLVDSLSFAADESLEKADKGFYFIRYGKRPGKPLLVINGYIRLTINDFIFKDTSFIVGETPEFTIGLYTLNNETAITKLVANVKFNIVSEVELSSYYKALKAAMKDTDFRDVEDVFRQDVYQFFGKPTDCQIKKIIDSAN